MRVKVKLIALDFGLIRIVVMLRVAVWLWL